MICDSILRMLAREHLHKPITGHVLTLGKQTIGLTLHEAIDILNEEGVVLNDVNIAYAKNLNLDESTRYGQNNNFLTDKALFSLLGIRHLSAMDVSTYENAEIIHNLNLPIPDNLLDSFDFIIDGGTFDHLFDLKTAFANITKLLKKSGRVFMWNGASNYTGVAYMSFAPDLFRDYFLINNYDDCKVYLAEVSRQAQEKKWNIYHYLRGRKYKDGMDPFHTIFLMMTVVIAEKGINSTTDKLPVQCFYRDDDQWSPYLQSEDHFTKSNRPVYQGKRLFSLIFDFFDICILVAYIIKHRWNVKAYRYIGRI